MSRISFFCSNDTQRPGRDGGEALVKKYAVRLTPEQRQDLHRLISTGAEAARKVQHAWIVLKAGAGEEGPGWTDEQISEALEVEAIHTLRPEVLALTRWQ
jgi:hypothetical protein